jgi:hypothetical protein
VVLAVLAFHPMRTAQAGEYVGLMLSCLYPLPAGR